MSILERDPDLHQPLLRRLGSLLLWEYFLGHEIVEGRVDASRSGSVLQ